MSAKRWLGIDFSGDAAKWRKAHRKWAVSSYVVWIAEVVEAGSEYRVDDLYPVQRLSERGHTPFIGLVSRLKRMDFKAAGIDAPFSVPEQFICTDHGSFLDEVARIHKESDRPFANGCDFRDAVIKHCRRSQLKKPMRRTEECWSKANPRSTLWASKSGKGRPGAPMTAACLTLLHQRGMPIWPWTRHERGLLVEAFPAAQLCYWAQPGSNLPWMGYNGSKGTQNRKRIIGEIKKRISVIKKYEQVMLQLADALDAVICAFAAIAVTEGKLACEPDPEFSKLEGWIAVHE